MSILRQRLVLAGVFLVALLVSVEASWARPNADRMLALHRHDRPTPTAIALIEPEVPVTTKAVKYVTIDGQGIEGYYARPENMSEPPPTRNSGNS